MQRPAAAWPWLPAESALRCWSTTGPKSLGVLGSRHSIPPPGQRGPVRNAPPPHRPHGGAPSQPVRHPPARPHRRELIRTAGWSTRRGHRPGSRHGNPLVSLRFHRYDPVRVGNARLLSLFEVGRINSYSVSTGVARCCRYDRAKVLRRSDVSGESGRKARVPTIPS